MKQWSQMKILAELVSCSNFADAGVVEGSCCPPRLHSVAKTRHGQQQVPAWRHLFKNGLKYCRSERSSLDA
jgi:hypothetical protein